VDVVAELTSAHYTDTSRLSPAELAFYEAHRVISNVKFTDSRTTCTLLSSPIMVRIWSRRANKCSAIDAASGRLEADVVSCLTYRSYSQYNAQKHDYYDGIKFYTRMRVAK